jgi:hypothetical protein
MSADPSTRPAYVSPTPMPADRIDVKTLVYVPIWRLGHVMKWGYARVLEIGEHEGKPVYLVELAHPFPDTQAEVKYFPYSVQCGMCVGRPTTEVCPQCRPAEPQEPPAENPWWS